MLVPLIQELGFIFYYENFYVAYDRELNKILGVVSAIDPTTNLEYDYSNLESVNHQYNFTVQNYLKVLIDEVKEKKYMYLVNVSVDVHYRSRRIGSRLLKYFIEQMHEAGFDEIGFDCLMHNLRAKNLYHSLGFKEVSEGFGFDGTEHSTVEKVLWLPKGLYNDVDTNGHVDNICNFVRLGVVVLAWSDDKNDPQYEISRRDYAYLRSVKDAKGRKLEIHKLYCPTPQYITAEEGGGIDYVEGTLPRNEGDRMAASYVNYLTGNGFIALPVFNDPMDEKAIKLLQELYPDRKIEPIYAREILLGGGNIHCITQQVPHHTN